MNTSRVAFTLGCMALWLIAGVAGLYAQNAAPVAPKAGKDVAPKPPNDPFVVGGKSATAPSKPPVVEDVTYNLVFTFETYTLPQPELDALHEEGLGSRPLYDRVRKLVADGQASLESVISLPTRSGQRAAIESIDELLYPTQFSPPVAGRRFGFPSAWEMRPLGERVELDPVVGPGGAIVDLNTAVEFTRLAKFTVVKADPSADGELQPLFVSRKITTAASCKVGEPTLLGTTNSPWGAGVQEVDGDGSTSLTFARCRLFTPLPNAASPPPKQTNTDGATKNIRMVYRFYSLPRAKARDILEEAADADALWQRTTALPKDEVKLERLITVITRSGHRSTTEEIGEWTYGTEADPSGPPKSEGGITAPQKVVGPNDANAKQGPPALESEKGEPLLPAIFTALEMRPIGWRIEVDPVLGPDEVLVDLNLAPSVTEYRGAVQGHPLLARYPECPLFGTQKVTTAVTAAVGRQCFLGTFNRPGDTGANGRQDDGRTWFAFVVATIE